MFFLKKIKKNSSPTIPIFWHLQNHRLLPQVVKSRILQEHSTAQELATVHGNDREAAKRAHDYIIASDDAVFLL